MSLPIRFAIAALAATPAQASTSELALNPVRKVVTMLQSMQKKVQKEGEEEKELYEKFMCYCKNSGGDLSGSISAAEEKIPAVSSDIEAAEAKLSQSKDDLKQAQSDRASAKAAMKEATAIREKEAAAYAAYKADADANTAAIAKAVTAVENGMAGSFLQTPAAMVLRKLGARSSLGDSDQQTLTAFLANSYAPASGEIVGILKQMGDTMLADLQDATSAEETSIKNYKALISAKTKEVDATTATIEAKSKQIGELGVDIVQMKEDVSDTAASLAEDKKFKAELEKGCSTKTAEWEERSKTRAEELVALADTVKVLNDDDALELFKKTLPSASASFMQVDKSMSAVREHALATLKAATAKANRGDRAGLELLSLALAGQRSGKVSFAKVIKMIDEMVVVLQTEQQDDIDKKEYCEKQFDLADDKKKGLERSIKKEENAIATAKEAIATLTEEIAALTAGIKKLDKSVAEATEQRKEENAEYKALVAADTAAKELLGWAKNRLNKFYNPKLYKAPPKKELSAEDRIYSNNGNPDDLVTTAAPGGIANTGISFVQIKAHSHDIEAPAPPPATWDAYAKKSESSNGVIAMIDLLIADMEKELTEAKTEEKDAQADYEQMMKDAAEKRTTDSKALTEKTAAKADTEAALEDHKAEHAAGVKELMATDKYISSLHAECDWLVQYFDVRKEARTDEIDSLKKAKAVLSGADYSFAQVKAQRFLGRA